MKKGFYSKRAKERPMTKKRAHWAETLVGGGVAKRVSRTYLKKIRRSWEGAKKEKEGKR